MSNARKSIITATLAGRLAFAFACGFSIDAAHASDFNADKVMTGMNAEERYSYLAGVVEGLAVARYMKDGKTADGMDCIYGWFYEDMSTMNTILTAFERYGSYTPGAVMDVLAKQRCGE